MGFQLSKIISDLKKLSQTLECAFKLMLKNTPFLRFFEINFPSTTWLPCIDALLNDGTFGTYDNIEK